MADSLAKTLADTFDAKWKRLIDASKLAVPFDTAMGAVTGAFGGGALGALLDHNRRLRGALIGAAGGGVLGGGIGHAIGKQIPQGISEAHKLAQESDEWMATRAFDAVQKAQRQAEAYKKQIAQMRAEQKRNVSPKQAEENLRGLYDVFLGPYIKKKEQQRQIIAVPQGTSQDSTSAGGGSSAVGSLLSAGVPNLNLTAQKMRGVVNTVQRRARPRHGASGKW